MANMSFGVNIVPTADNTYTLGNSDKKWNLYVNQINGKTFVPGIPFGYCDQPADSDGVYSVSIDGISGPQEGLSIRVLFKYAQTYNGTPQLKLNNNNYAYAIMRTPWVSAGLAEWGQGAIIDLVYYYSSWNIVNGGSLKIG